MRLFSKEIKRGELHGVPAKTKFLWGEKPLQEILFPLPLSTKLEGESKRGEASLISLLPPPLIREGDTGGRLPNKMQRVRGWYTKMKGSGTLLLNIRKALSAT